MSIVAYPSWLPQCEPTNREEVTTVLAEVSENGVIRGRAMHDRPTYRLFLSHRALTVEDFERWEAWWQNNFNNEVDVTWVPDGASYRGVFEKSPQVSYVPYKRFDVSVELLVKRNPTVPVIAAPGTPGWFDPPLVPATLADLAGYGALGNTAVWSTGEYVILGDASEAHWDGHTWSAGKAP